MKAGGVGEVSGWCLVAVWIWLAAPLRMHAERGMGMVCRSLTELAALSPRVLFPSPQSPKLESQAASAHFEVETSPWIHFPK